MMAEGFDREVLHMMLTRAIEKMRGSGMQISANTEDALYRIGCVGAMSVYAQMGIDVPPSLSLAVMSGQRLVNNE